MTLCVVGFFFWTLLEILISTESIFFLFIYFLFSFTESEPDLLAKCEAQSRNLTLFFCYSLGLKEKLITLHNKLALNYTIIDQNSETGRAAALVVLLLTVKQLRIPDLKNQPVIGRWLPNPIR